MPLVVQRATAVDCCVQKRHTPARPQARDHRESPAFIRTMHDTFLASIRALRKQVTQQAVRRVLESKDSSSLVSLSEWQRSLLAMWTPLFSRQMLQHGRLALQNVRKVVRKAPGDADADFSLDNQFARKWIDTYPLDLITNIGDTTRDAIQGVLEEGYVTGLSPDQQASLMKDFIGLTPRDAAAVGSMAESMVEGDYSDEEIDAQCGAYADRMLEQRAMTIARTESLRAANQGELAGWQDAQDRGILDDQAQKMWYTIAEGNGACRVCEDELSDQTVDMQESFSCSLGDIDCPPAHPNCHCRMRVVVPEVEGQTSYEQPDQEEEVDDA